MTKQEQLVIILLILAALLGTGFLYYRKVHEPPVKPEVVKVKDWPGPKEIVVEVKGACWRPGVYTFSEGARVKEVIDKASPRADAFLDSLNLARRLKDGEEIFIPRRQLPSSPGLTSISASASEKARSSPQEKLNINQASAEELEKLPQIGPRLAGHIVDYRNTHGPFRAIEDIKNVDKIGEGTFKKIKDLIMVEETNGNAY